MRFLLGEREDFIMFLMIGQSNGPLQAKKKTPQNICASRFITTN
jgi:hypothetical protein